MADKTPVQVRLTSKELEVLDTVVTLATQRTMGIRGPVSRPDALKWAFMTGARQLLSAGERGDGAPSTGPALIGLEQAAPAPALPLSPDQEDEARKARSITPLQQVALASPPPQAVEDAAAVPVPELENSVDMGGAGFDPAKFTFGKLCKGKHEYGQTGQTLLRLPARVCAQCESERRKQKRARQREGKA